VLTDARGERLDDRPLLGSGHDFQMSCVCASTPELHATIIASLDAGIERLRAAGPR
jgi:myo-inositol-1(or 4)-monophosphatase